MYIDVFLFKSCVFETLSATFIVDDFSNHLFQHLNMNFELQQLKLESQNQNID